MDTQGKLIPENTGFLLHDQGDSIHQIRYLVDGFKNKTYDLPLHQRDFVWKYKKQKDWLMNLLRSDYKPCGVIVIYQLRIDNKYGSNKFINDGYQRLYTIIKAQRDPSSYGLHEKDLEDILNQDITVQKRIYNTHEDAAQQFQFLNIGTAMTAYEYYKTNLVYLKNWESYEEIIKKVIKEMNEADMQVISKKPTEENQKGIRDVYGLIVRTLTENYSSFGTHYRTISNKKPDETNEDKNIEMLLRGELEKITISQFNEISKKIINSIHQIKALLMDSIQDANKLIEERNNTKIFGITKIIKNNHITYKLWRWIFINIYCLKMKNIKPDILKKVTIEILAMTGGTSIKNIIYNNEGLDVVPNYQNIITFRTLFNEIGFGYIYGEAYVAKSKDRKKRNKEHIPKGFDNSHPIDKPFSIYGECKDNDMFTEPSMINRSRGNKVTGE